MCFKYWMLQKEYAQPEILDHIFVYDDGIVKGLIHLEQTEIAEFYVDHFFSESGNRRGADRRLH